MDYKCPYMNDLGGIGQPMNPFVDAALRFGPTRVMADPNAGYAQVIQTGLDGRHFERHFFEPGVWELSGRNFERNFFEPGVWALSGRQFDRNYFEVLPFPRLDGWRDALDVFTAASFLFPE